jgi:hypothetical protein
MKNCFGKLIIRGAYNLSIAVDKAPQLIFVIAAILSITSVTGGIAYFICSVF